MRNWDYRFCWVRDATLMLQSLMHAGYMDEAAAWRDWLLRAVAGSPSEMQIMYGPAGERRLTELELDWLPGYEGSAPVRIGNAASGQFQLDVYGELMDALAQAREGGIEPDDDAWRLQVALMDYLEGAWERPDEGIWEVRGQRRQFVHSKVMAWVAFDRAVRMVERHGQEGPVERWRELRAAVHREVCERGYDAERNTFTQSYGSRGLDAATLLIPVVGFLPPRRRARDRHRRGGAARALPRRLRAALRHDARRTTGCRPARARSCPARSGSPTALTLIGRHEEAREMFDRLAGLANDVGLLAEEYDPRAGRLVGNFPQAFTHVGLVNTAINLDRAATSPARDRAGRRPVMRAITLQPGVKDSAALEEVPEPPAEEGALLVDGVALGICGTDAEIVRGDYGEAPPGAERLVLGHESLGRVAEAPDGSGFAPGDLVVGIVRRPDPVPCPSCAAGEWDFCRNGRYTERGIKALHGYGSERWRIEPEFAVQARSRARRARRADGADDDRGEGVGADRPRARARDDRARARARHRRRPDRAARRAARAPARLRPDGARPRQGRPEARARARPRRHLPLRAAHGDRPAAGRHRRGDGRQPGRARRDEPHGRQRDRLPDRHLLGRARDRARRRATSTAASCSRTTSSSARSTRTGATTRPRRRRSPRPTTPGSSA